MTVRKVTQVTVSGLATNPNPNGLPLGSCAVANNVFCRQPGILTPMPAIESITNGGGFWRKAIPDPTNSGIALVADDGNDPSWTPGTSETMTGTLLYGNTLGSSISQLPIGTATARNIGFIPGMTQGAYSHFRTLITEKWGVVANFERFAGFPPPAVVWALADTTYTWLKAGNSVAYCANFTLESKNTTDAQYIVNGPVSAVSAVTNFSGSDASTALNWVYYSTEPLSAPADAILYLNIYRSSQAAVASLLDLADDFQLVWKLDMSTFPPGTAINIFDSVDDDGRAAGTYLYTNSSQQGSGASSYAPPAARDICVFKDTVFYANRSSLPALTLTVPGAFGLLVSNVDKTNGVGWRQFLTATLTSGSTTVSFSDAADLTGVVAHQLFHTDAGFYTTVVSVNLGAKTIVVTDPAPITGPATGFFKDAYFLDITYADGTTASVSDDVLSFDRGSVASIVPPPSCFRMITPAVSAVYPVQEVTGVKFTILQTMPATKRVASFTWAMTSGENAFPSCPHGSPTPSIVDNRPNRIYFSKTGEPEAVPVGQYLDVGAQTILKMWANQSALFIFCTDGLWKITGDGTNWSVAQIDPTALLMHPDGVSSLNNQIYAWLQDGIATVTEDGAMVMSTDAIGPALRAAAVGTNVNAFPYVWGPSMTGDHYRNELWLILANAANPQGTWGWPQLIGTYVYNDDTKQFTSQTENYFTAALYDVFARETKFLFADRTTGLSPFYYLDHLTLDPSLGTMGWEVWFNPIQSPEKGELKQWIDVNFFLTNYVASVAPIYDYAKALFDGSGTSADATADTVNRRLINSNADAKDLHFWVPRRAVLGDQLQIGLKSVETINGFGLDIQGFTVRYRDASNTFRR